MKEKLSRSLLNKRDYVRAIRAIPIGIRRLYVQAYQAYIFNLCISESLSCGEDITKCRDGDLCFEIEGKDGTWKDQETKPQC